MQRRKCGAQSAPTTRTLKGATVATKKQKQGQPAKWRVVQHLTPAGTLTAEQLRALAAVVAAAAASFESLGKSSEAVVLNGAADAATLRLAAAVRGPDDAFHALGEYEARVTKILERWGVAISYDPALQLRHNTTNGRKK